MAQEFGSNQSHIRPSTINEALRILDEALAGDKTLIKNMVTDQYQHLKSALGSAGGAASDVAATSYQQISEGVSNLANAGMETGRRVYYEVDSRVRSNPWAVIGGVAVGTFALGFLFGRGGSSDESTDYKH